ncbi:MAG: DUF4912 domain-containing protein [Planctomycetota bacterium]
MSIDKFSQLPLKDLRALAAGRGIPGSARLDKSGLIKALTQDLATSTRREPPPPAAHSGTSSSAAPSVRTWQPAPAEHGLPIPDSYGRDRLVLMVQDPSHVFAYWEVTSTTLDRVRSAANHTGSPVLVIGSEQREVDLRGGNYYLTVTPGMDYTAELSWRDITGHLHLIARSNTIRTPAAGPSARTDEAWMDVNERFIDLMNLAGLPGSAESSSARFRNRRQLNLSPVGVEDDTVGLPVPAVAHSNPSSIALVGATSPSSAELSRQPALSSRALSSGALLSSGSLSSRALSSRTLSSSSLANGGPTEVSFPIEGVFHAPVTGLPKAAEGLPSGAAPTTVTAAQTTQLLPPIVPPVAADPLAFLGAPKAKSLRKAKPKR